jgi:glyceraldehyde 3-phosphate dehydrogenase (phosphorylating)
MTRVAVNGFGRIGRTAFRAAFEGASPLELVAINDVADAPTLAALLEHDTVYGPFPGGVTAREHAVAVEGREIPVFNEADPRNLPWAELDVDVVLECTGKFKKREQAAGHLEAGARKVIVSAPSPDADATIVVGVNERTYDPARHAVISNASCTTNCLAPVVKTLHETIGIEHGFMTTVHAYTGDQRLVDGPHKDLRRARAAAWNLVPTTTGAARAIGLVIPELSGKLHGYAVRVPVPVGSLVDLTVEASRVTTVAEVDEAFRTAAVTTLDGILDFRRGPLVSSDIVKTSYSAVVDGDLTAVVDGRQVHVVAWYDNEWGYATRLVELAERVAVPAGREVAPV